MIEEKVNGKMVLRIAEPDYTLLGDGGGASIASASISRLKWLRWSEKILCG